MRYKTKEKSENGEEKENENAERQSIYNTIRDIRQKLCSNYTTEKGTGDYYVANVHLIE